MKCIRNTQTDEIRRVNDVKAMRLVVGGPWVYAKKSAWKAQKAGLERKANRPMHESQIRADEPEGACK